MAHRLDGPAFARIRTEHCPSDATPRGSLQVPGPGRLLLLMADHQTTGGYPKVATVISADIPALGRMMPGAAIAFAAVDIEAAEAAARQLAADIAGLAASVAPVRREPAVDATRLMGENLVSGVVSAREGSEP